MKTQCPLHRLNIRGGKAVTLLCLATSFSIGCNSLHADSLSSLNDDFSSTATLKQWKHVYKEEGYNANQLEHLKINGGWLTMTPYTSTWYRDYRGVMMFKPVSGNFVVTTRVRVSGRNKAIPTSLFSLAGLMVRTPRNITPQTWTPGGENYIFLSLGAANAPGTLQFEVKTTQNSDSQLQISNAQNNNDVRLQVARIGDMFIMLKRTSSGWSVHRRYKRSDFPSTLQVGLTCYTDWNSASQLTPPQHNNTVIKGGSPDLVAQFDYVRYKVPNVPQNANVETMSDAELLRFLGDAAM